MSSTENTHHGEVNSSAKFGLAVSPQEFVLTLPARLLHGLPSGYVAVRIVLGLLLLSAASLKTHQLATEPLLETGVFASRWFQIALVEIELLFGLVLVAGIFRRAAWLASIGLFATLALISLSKALSGDTSCGCFGKLQISPWYTLALDTAAIALLIIWRPRCPRLNDAIFRDSNSNNDDENPTDGAANGATTLFGNKWTIVIVYLLVAIPVARIHRRWRRPC